MTTKDMILDLDVNDVVTLWNEYCDANDYYDDKVYNNDEDFLELFSPLEIAQKVSYGDYTYTDDYIIFNGLANFVTFNYMSELIQHIDLEAMIDWMNDNEIDWEDLI